MRHSLLPDQRSFVRSVLDRRGDFLHDCIAWSRLRIARLRLRAENTPPLNAASLAIVQVPHSREPRTRRRFVVCSFACAFAFVFAHVRANAATVAVTVRFAWNAPHLEAQISQSLRKSRRGL